MAISDVVSNVRELVETPLTTPLDTVHLFLIVGVVIVAIGAWSLIWADFSRALPEL